jgi:2-oxoglutarate dehydrogenase E1 component
VVLTPKSLLRHPQATSTMSELSQGSFQEVIDEVDAAIAKRADRVLLCTGKIYYDLLAARAAKGASQTAIIRVEQLYPGLDASLGAVMSKYKKKAQVVWVQEEPLNMGAWPHLCLTTGRRLLGQWNLDVVARPAAASPAVGSHSRHQIEQDALMDQAFSS